MKGKQLVGRYFIELKMKKALQGTVVISKITDDFQTLNNQKTHRTFTRHQQPHDVVYDVKLDTLRESLWRETI